MAFKSQAQQANLNTQAQQQGPQSMLGALVAALNDKSKGELTPPTVAHQTPFAHKGKKQKAIHKALTDKGPKQASPQTKRPFQK